MCAAANFQPTLGNCGTTRCAAQPAPCPVAQATISMKEIEKLEAEHIKFYTDMGYGEPIKMDGKIVALGPFLFTTGIMVGMNDTGYEHRFCYHTEDQAMIALLAWIGSDDDEPEGYLVKK